MFEQICFANRSRVFGEARAVPQLSAPAEFISSLNYAHGDTSLSLSTWQTVLVVALLIFVPTLALMVMPVVVRAAQRCFRLLSVLFS